MFWVGDVMGVMVYDVKIVVICFDYGVDEFVIFDCDFSKFFEFKVCILVF